MTVFLARWCSVDHRTQPELGSCSITALLLVVALGGFVFLVVLLLVSGVFVLEGLGLLIGVSLEPVLNCGPSEGLFVLTEDAEKVGGEGVNNGGNE